jgi:hypothetical protein
VTVLDVDFSIFYELYPVHMSREGAEQDKYRDRKSSHCAAHSRICSIKEFNSEF